MNKQILTLALIFGLVVSSLADPTTGEKDKDKPSTSAMTELPVLTSQDLEALLADMGLARTPNDRLQIAPQTYQVFDNQGNLLMEETVQFENRPSPEMKAIIRSGEFLMEKGDLLIYKVF